MPKEEPNEEDAQKAIKKNECFTAEDIFRDTGLFHMCCLVKPGSKGFKRSYESMGTGWPANNHRRSFKNVRANQVTNKF